MKFVILILSCFFGISGVVQASDEPMPQVISADEPHQAIPDDAADQSMSPQAKFIKVQCTDRRLYITQDTCKSFFHGCSNDKGCILRRLIENPDEWAEVGDSWKLMDIASGKGFNWLYDQMRGGRPMPLTQQYVPDEADRWEYSKTLDLLGMTEIYNAVVDKRRQENEDLIKEEKRKEEKQRQEQEAKKWQHLAGIFGSTFTFDAVQGEPFTMGSPANDPDKFPNEPLRPNVNVPPFEMQMTKFTQAHWVNIMKGVGPVDKLNPSRFQNREDCPEDFLELNGVKMCLNHPVERVDLADVNRLLAKLNSMNDGYRYRLPSEEEWEFAARAGFTTIYPWAGGKNDMANYAWYHPISGNKTHSVFGKFDLAHWRQYMLGNVWEWTSSPYINQDGTPGGFVVRGGGWGGDSQDMRPARRGGIDAGGRGGGLGFRLVRTAS